LINNLHILRERSPRYDYVQRLLKRHPMTLARAFEIIEYGVRFKTSPGYLEEKGWERWNIHAEIRVVRRRRFEIEYSLKNLERGDRFARSVIWHELVHAHIMLLYGDHAQTSAGVETVIDKEAYRVARKKILTFAQWLEVFTEPEAVDYYRLKIG